MTNPVLWRFNWLQAPTLIQPDMTAAVDTDALAPPLHWQFSEDGMSAGVPLAFTGISADKLFFFLNLFGTMRPA